MADSAVSRFQPASAISRSRKCSRSRLSSTSSTVGLGGGTPPGCVSHADVQLVPGFGDLHAHARSRVHLVGGHQRSQRLSQIAMDGAVQLARAVFRAGALLEQELARLERHFQGERTLAQPRVDVVLQVGDLLVEDGRERLRRSAADR